MWRDGALDDSLDILPVSPLFDICLRGMGRRKRRKWSVVKDQSDYGEVSCQVAGRLAQHVAPCLQRLYD